MYNEPTRIQIKSPDELLSSIYPAVMTKAEMAQREKPCPHRDIPGTDLVQCVGIHVDGGVAIATNDVMHSLHLTQKEFLDRAVKNQSDSSYTLVPLPAMIGLTDSPSPPIMVLTSASMMMGAGEMLNRAALQEAAKELGSDILILPSSKHEVLLVSRKDMDIPTLEEMVTTINRDVVSKDDRLSDHVYAYDAETQRFSMASQTECIDTGITTGEHLEGGLKI